MNNIVIIHKSGGDFAIADVYLLASHIHKHKKEGQDLKVYCFSDTAKVPIEVVGLTILPLPHLEWSGWWSKMNLFSPELKEFRPFLYLDIDTAVLKPINDLFPPERAKDNFVTLRDFYRPNRLATGVLWVPNAKVTEDIYSEWIKVPSKYIKKFRGDQDFVASVTKADLYWQDISKPDFVTTFKPRGMWRTEFPENSAVVCFHGKPRIPVAAKSVEWVKLYTQYAI